MKTMMSVLGVVLFFVTVTPLQAIVVSDNFNRDVGTDVGDGWTESVGDWEIQERTNSSGYTHKYVTWAGGGNPGFLLNNLELVDNYTFDYSMAMSEANYWAGGAFNVSTDGSYYLLRVKITGAVTQGLTDATIQFLKYSAGGVFDSAPINESIQFRKTSPASAPPESTYFALQTFTIDCTAPGEFSLSMGTSAYGVEWTGTVDDTAAPLTGGYAGFYNGMYYPTSAIYFDNFSLEVASEPVLLEGDANRDGVVSAGDYASVQSNFGNVGDPGILGDANGDGVVSAGDYASVQANFGNVAPTGVVPEPGTMAICVIGVVAGLVRKTRRLR